MKTLRYIEDVAKLELNREKCVGCSMCIAVCPHRVFQLVEKKAEIIDHNGCMECGACSINCPVEAITVTPGVGCASLIISRWLKGKKIATGGCC